MARRLPRTQGRRKPGPVPTYAKSMAELGLYLTPPRDRKIIQQATKLEGNPGRSRDGRYHIAEWQGFVNANFKSLLDPNVGGTDVSKKRPAQKDQSEVDALVCSYWRLLSHMHSSIFPLCGKTRHSRLCLWCIGLKSGLILDMADHSRT